MALVLAGSYLCESDMTALEYAAWLEQSPLQALDQGARRMESAPVLLARSLEVVSPAARRALGAVGLLAQAPFEREWVREALGMGEGEALQAFGELSRYSLLRRGSDGWYQVSHALVHAYARERLRAEAGEEALEGLAEAFEFEVVKACDQGVEGFGELNHLKPHALVILERLADEGNWLVGSGIPGRLDKYLYLQGLSTERIRLAECQVRGARRTGNRKEEANWLNAIGLARAEQGQIVEAIGHHEQALAIDREIHDRRSEGWDLGNLGHAYARLGLAEKAIGYYEQALAIAQETGDRRGEGNRLGNLGNQYLALNWIAQAIEYYKQALIIEQEADDRSGVTFWLGGLGSAYAKLGQVERAIEYYEQVLVIAKKIGYRGCQ